MVRISKNVFIRDDQICFNIDRVDHAFTVESAMKYMMAVLYSNH